LGKRGHLPERREDEEDRAAGRRSDRSWGRSGKRLVAAAALRCGRGVAARENGAGYVVCVTLQARELGRAARVSLGWLG